MAKKIYDTAQLHLKNVTELGEIFDLHRDTVRRRLKAYDVKPHRQQAGVNVYVLKEAAEAIVKYDLA
ncbi:hypothetical protein V6O07_16670, partial [Arthrospira platensis SPKY2]